MDHPSTLRLKDCTPHKKIFQAGLQSYNNIGYGDEQGLPLPLAHQTDRFEATDDPNCVVIPDVQAALRHLKEVYGDVDLIEREPNQFVFTRPCATEDRCQFILPRSLFKNLPEGQAIESTTHDRLTPIMQQRFDRYSLNPTIDEDIAYISMENRWATDFSKLYRNQLHSSNIQAWRTKYYPRLQQWKNRTDFPNVSLIIKTVVDPPTLKPRSVAAYGMEVECEEGSCSSNFLDVAHEDDSGPMEITTEPHTNPLNLFKELQQYTFIQHGQLIPEITHGCGSHIHVQPTADDPTIAYQSYRGLLGLFAPFFAGTVPLQESDDFNFRSAIKTWARVPPLYKGVNLYDVDGSKHSYVHPHPDDGHKPFTFEFRLNESVAPSAITAINIISRIADAFADLHMNPTWSDELTQFNHNAIPGNNIKKIDQLCSPLTDSRYTTEVLNFVLGTDIDPNQRVCLTDILHAARNKMPLYSFEKRWIDRILRKQTWSNMLRMSEKRGDRKYQNRQLARLQKRIDQANLTRKIYGEMDVNSRQETLDAFFPNIKSMPIITTQQFTADKLKIITDFCKSTYNIECNTCSKTSDDDTEKFYCENCCA